MVLECLTWMPHLLFSLIGFVMSHEKGFGSFPDDILVNILSRLSAHSVKRCRIVCRHWRALTSSSYFVELQSTRAQPVILMQCLPSSFHSRKIPKIRLYVFDKIASKFMKIDVKSEAYVWKAKPELMWSCGRLLILRGWSPTGTYVFDPMTQDERNIQLYGYGFCGIYFDPLASEYKCLGLFEAVRGSYHYFVYGFKSEVGREIASSSPVQFHPIAWSLPAIVNLALHWIVDHTTIHINGIDPCEHAIMVFKMNSEEIFTVPHPRINCAYRRIIHKNMHLFVKDEQHLSICHLSHWNQNIDIWILEDYENWHWVQSYKINIGVDRHIEYQNYRRLTDVCAYEIKAMSVGKDELLIDSTSHGFYLWDLKMNIVKKILVPILGDNYTDYAYYPVVYTNSLATPSLYD